MCGASSVMTFEDLGDIRLARDFNKTNTLYNVYAIEHGKETKKFQSFFETHLYFCKYLVSNIFGGR